MNTESQDKPQWFLIYTKPHQEKRAKENLENWKQSLIKDVIDSVALELDVGFGKIGLPLRLALTANTNSPSIDLVCELLGKEVSLKRLDSFLINIKDQEKTL